MAEKFKNKYRIPSARLPSWDYGWNAAYFVTICTGHRVEYFGQIVNGQMALSPIGKLADQYWREIPKHFPFVILDAYVIMPNHVHGIVIINKTDNGRDNLETQNSVETQNFASQSPQHRKPYNKRTDRSKNKFGPQSQNLASIIRGYKSAVKKYATMNKIDFSWQSRFYDRIIRNENAFNKIRQYILNNPAKWQDDQNNQKGLWI